MMMQAALGGAVKAALAGVGSGGAGAGDAPGSGGAPPAPPVTVGVSPMFHISGYTTQIIGGVYLGGTWVFPPPGRWDEVTHMRLTEQYGATSWSLVPTQLWRLLEHPEFHRFDLSSVGRVGGGGATFQPELWRAVQERFGTQVVMGTGYGMSETCGAGTSMSAADAAAHPDAIGRAGPGLEIEVRDPAGRVLPDGEVGEIHLRGAVTMLGYWANPEATARSLDENRWYRAGEYGHISDGLLYLDSRGSDLVIRGGENIYPIEIENRLIEHPEIAEVAVVGVEHRTLGQEVAAHVVRVPGSTLDAEGVRAWAAAALAPYKVPSIVSFPDALPHNASGKVLKHLIGKPVNLVEE
jgi:acyl-CoA synthetase (AMP-forming)/AMP-acid ligase II